jgi:hypothetical protein
MDLCLRMTLGALALLALPAWADAVKPLPGDGRLVYLQQAAHGCVLKLWDSKDGSTRDLTALPECPKHIDVTSDGKSLMLLDKADIRVFDLANGTLGEPMALPAMETPKSAFGVGLARAGFTADGTQALEMVAGNKDDSQDNFLFLRTGGQWSQVERVHCDRMVPDCSFKQTFDGRPLGGVWGTTGATEIWNDALRGDPYVVKRIPETSSTRTADFDGANTLVFHAYGRYSKLVFREESGEDTGGTYTFRLKLVTPDGKTLDITDAQFDATIVGHYLLFYGFFHQGTRLYDLGDGKVVLDGFSVVGWLP